MVLDRLRRRKEGKREVGGKEKRVEGRKGKEKMKGGPKGKAGRRKGRRIGPKE